MKMLSKWRHYGWSFSLLLSAAGFIRLANRHVNFWVVTYHGRVYEVTDGFGTIQCYEYVFPVVRHKVFRLVYLYVPVVALLPPYYWILNRWERRRSPAGFCKCGYDLTGNTSGVCPECGTAINSKDVPIKIA